MSGSFRHVLRYFPDEVFIPLVSKLDEMVGNEVLYELGQDFLTIVDKIYATEETKLIAQEKQLRDAGEIEFNIKSTMQLYTARFMYLERLKEELSHFFDTEPYEQEDDYIYWFSIFERRRLPWAINERVILDFLHLANEKLADYDTELTDRFFTLIGHFVWQHELSYQILKPFEIRPLITSEFPRMYKELKRFEGGSGDLVEALQDFEASYALYKEKGEASDLNNCIKNIFVYLEAITGEKIDQRGKALGELAKECEKAGLFPHKGSISKSLSSMYGFPSDYPRLRHAGNPKSKIRELVDQDCINISMLAIIWAGYINSLESVGD